MRHLVHIDISIGGRLPIGYSEGVLDFERALEVGQDIPISVWSEMQLAGVDCSVTFKITDVMEVPDVPGNEGLVSILVCDEVSIESQDVAKALMNVLDRKYGLKTFLF